MPHARIASLFAWMNVMFQMFAQTVIICPTISTCSAGLPHIVLYTFCEVASSKALKVKVDGFDVDDNGTVVKVNFESHRMGDAEATALAEVHEQMPM